jgi:hypothetical protein
MEAGGVVGPMSEAEKGSPLWIMETMPKLFRLHAEDADLTEIEVMKWVSKVSNNTVAWDEARETFEECKRVYPSALKTPEAPVPD